MRPVCVAGSDGEPIANPSVLCVLLAALQVPQAIHFRASTPQAQRRVVVHHDGHATFAKSIDNTVVNLHGAQTLEAWVQLVIDRALGHSGRAQHLVENGRRTTVKPMATTAEQMPSNERAAKPPTTW
eukprot:CAMPEP_0115676778 /NCGR_PEP_ID=MMETSP0272-20121206/54873_1 /TAXON_ID=71861 /ORGANISM="Scrippsiella trochoidea, Strain CCMP3099" /LENGTH=126 /DNA_ID=CAMNT_0003115851 /DNA_START=806 /DNA_END=1187 /DNA_ORIENTATION=-